MSHCRLTELSSDQLVALYNKHVAKPIARFENRRIGIKRTGAILEQHTGHRFASTGDLVYAHDGERFNIEKLEFVPIDGAPQPVKGQKANVRAKDGKKPAAATSAPMKAPKAATGADSGKRSEKRAKFIAMMEAGTTIAALMEAFGWQPHSARAAISTLGKTRKIESEKTSASRTYRIIKGD